MGGHLAAKVEVKVNADGYGTKYAIISLTVLLQTFTIELAAIVNDSPTLRNTGHCIFRYIRHSIGSGNGDGGKNG